MDDKEKKILKFAQLAIKQQRAEGDFTQDDNAEMKTILAGLQMTREEALNIATSLLVS